ncbi:hypothetical protein CGCA056_v011168 [Colletotrichum aenigma]|uniref:uncharacterized protein n=1 Tax=Colletotrichum aenigma TaxID=1215731 RepID=UPI001872955D|nr:uncharacterized protein CGCA056_v011168 [Colletotrichum aenigma]KAF5518367.1 hypothetical protein CGCA056_v011168 [Colletotrichum aenigma]
MSSHASIKSPTPGSSSTSRGKAPQSLAQEMEDQKMKDDSSSEDDADESQPQLDKINHDFKKNARHVQPERRSPKGTPGTSPQEVKDIFFSFTGYVKALESLFLDPDEQRQAERDLSHLRQTKSATLYAAEFRRLAARLHMTDESKVFAFYQGLKDEVKDEMAKLETPPSFLAYVEHAIKKFNSQQNDNRPCNNWNNTRQSTAYRQHSRPIDLSMMTKPNNKKPWNPKCYNCNK